MAKPFTFLTKKGQTRLARLRGDAARVSSLRQMLNWGLASLAADNATLHEEQAMRGVPAYPFDQAQASAAVEELWNSPDILLALDLVEEHFRGNFRKFRPDEPVMVSSVRVMLTAVAMLPPGASKEDRLRVALTALLHDIIEDSMIYGQHSEEEARHMGQAMLTEYFGAAIANDVVALTDPRVIPDALDFSPLIARQKKYNVFCQIVTLADMHDNNRCYVVDFHRDLRDGKKFPAKMWADNMRTMQAKFAVLENFPPTDHPVLGAAVERGLTGIYHIWQTAMGLLAQQTQTPPQPAPQTLEQILDGWRKRAGGGSSPGARAAALASLVALRDRFTQLVA